MADYGDEQDHANAMLALLRAQSNLTVYPATGGGATTVPNAAPPPYVSVHFVSEHMDNNNLTMLSTRLRTRAFVHCVGANDIAARAMAAKVRDAWLDVTPDIPGRSVYPIRHEQTRDAQVAEPVAATTVTITVIYRLEDQPGRQGS